MRGTKPVTDLGNIRKRQTAIRSGWTREESARRRAIATDRQRRLLNRVFGPDSLEFKTTH